MHHIEWILRNFQFEGLKFKIRIQIQSMIRNTSEYRKKQA